MSVPFSNTHLRAPRGFGTILEGLTREVLRDQPENIPQYAAQYFDSLLKQREESGMDPAEWAAKLEDRFYNNHAFKTAKTSPGKETVTETTISKEKSDESPTEDESSCLTHVPNLSTQQSNVPEKADLIESTEEEEEGEDEEEKQSITGEHISVETEEESINMISVVDIQSEEPSSTDKEKDPTITTLDQVDRSANETDSSSAPDQNIPQSESEPADLLSYSGISDVCAEELGVAEDEEGDKQETAAVDEETVDSDGEEGNEIAEPVDIFPYSGVAEVDVCAAELTREERTVEGPAAEDDTNVIEAEESLQSQPEDELSLSRCEITEGTQQEAEHQAEKTKEEEGTETEAEETHKGLAHTEGGLDGNIIPKEDSLVEISFEDVPEAQQITEVGEKQPEEESSAEVLQTEKLEMQQKEESEELTATDQNISDTQEHDKPDTEGGEKEVISEGEEIESQQKPLDVMKENMDTNDSDDDEMEKGVKNISLSDQPTTEADKASQEDEIGHKREDNEEISEGKFHQNEESEIETQSNKPDVKEDETTEPVGGDKEETYTEVYHEVANQEMNDGEAENNSSQVTQSNASMAGMEAQSETFEESEQRLTEENEESQRTLVESQPEDTAEEKEVTSKTAEELTEGMIDSKVQEESDVTHREENIGLSQGADWMAAENQREETPLESVKDATELEIKNSEKEECSRPQEEEDIMDIPLDDPEANRAAAKIQAGFRGHMTRKKLKPEDKAEGEEVSSTGDVLNGSQGDSETGRSGAVERDDTSVPEQ